MLATQIFQNSSMVSRFEVMNKREKKKGGGVLFFSFDFGTHFLFLIKVGICGEKHIFLVVKSGL